jgi:hypothetical protein
MESQPWPEIIMRSFFTASDVTAPAWPESPSLGPAYSGSGFKKLSAEPCELAQAWPGLALAQDPAYNNKIK